MDAQLSHYFCAFLNRKIGLKKDEILPYGSSCAKFVHIKFFWQYFFSPSSRRIQLGVLDRLKSQPNGKYIDVTAISPTPLGLS